MKRLWFVALVVALVMLLAASGVAWAGYFFEDPIFQVGGNTVNVLIGMDTSEPVSQPTMVSFLVPRNVPASVLDPQECVAGITLTAKQNGFLRVSLAMVKAPRSDLGHSFPVLVTVSDDAGYALERQGRAGAWIAVPYIQWVK